MLVSQKTNKIKENHELFKKFRIIPDRIQWHGTNWLAINSVDKGLLNRKIEKIETNSMNFF